MKHLFIFVCVILFLLVGLRAQPVQASGEGIYIVQAGDTLSSIAASFGISLQELAAVNGLTWDTWVYANQQLVIPARESMPAGQPGSSFGEPSRTALSPAPFPDTAAPLQDLTVIWIEVDPATQPLPAYETQTATSYTSGWPGPAPIAQPGPQAEPLSYSTANGEKWIDVNLTTQRLIAYEGQVPVYEALVSSGTAQYPTVAGTYQIYVKYEKARMRGGSGVTAYDLADVPYVMYFHRGYGLHGTYWHSNFGTPMSHGCVNLSIGDAEWLFNWAPIGTRVVTHY